MGSTHSNVSSEKLLTLESLGLSTFNIYPAIIFGTLAYLMIVICNLLVSITIAVSKCLHRPMFILLFNLPISDMVGATSFFPHFVLSIITQNRQITYSACVAQAFSIHFYGTANLLILSAMAYDRYVAICSPLRYNTIMTPQRMIKIIFSVWFVAFLFMFILFMLLVRFKSCRTNIVDLYCNNPSLLKLVCEDTTVNNYYGIVGIFLLQGGTLSIIAYTYVQILRTCIMTKNPESRRKAIQTCGSHLIVFLVMQINTIFTLTAHRLDNISPYMRRSLGLSVLVFPPLLDPIIYGLRVKQLKQNIILLVKRVFS